MQPRTATPAPRVAGRAALVTGATAGIGFHIAEALAAMGAEVVVTTKPARPAP